MRGGEGVAIIKTIHITEGPGAGATVLIDDSAWAGKSREEIEAAKAEARRNFDRIIHDIYARRAEAGEAVT